MRGFVANTDYDWFTFLRGIEPPIDDVNFWKPGSETAFRALQPGEPLFFKLKAPRNVIAGFGYFVHFSTLPVSMVWQEYQQANGAPSYADMRERLLRIRQRFDISTDPKQDFWIGCILVNQPVFFDDHEFVRIPDDFSGPIVQGKRYDLTSGEGERIWYECMARAARRPEWIGPYAGSTEPLGVEMIADAPLRSGYGEPALIRPRLGQRSFRIAVLDSYGRRCAVTNEKTLPALEAAHIRDYRDVQEHSLTNGILFRADIHKLFDAGYVTVTPDYHFEVSRRIKEEFENGRDYYALHGSVIRLPKKAADTPAAEALFWHNEQRYQG
jgi:putative restriction endonuclease